MQEGGLTVFYIELLLEALGCHDIVQDSLARRAEAEYNERFSGYGVRRAQREYAQADLR
jgi:hypothetical protein